MPFYGEKWKPIEKENVKSINITSEKDFTKKYIGSLPNVDNSNNIIVPKESTQNNNILIVELI